jgi:competence protein ComFC
VTDKLLNSSVSVHYRFKYAVSALLEFFLPPVCASCNKVGYIICDECLLRFHPLTKPIYANLNDANSLSYKHRLKQYPLKYVWAAAVFQSPISDMIHKLKYNGQFALAAPLGEFMATAWDKSRINMAELVLPIPLHPQRKKERGYNQSELLARHFCEATNLAYNFQALHRIKYTTPQVGLNANSRMSNVKDAFWAKSEDIAGKRLLLVDDVFTTGSTLTQASNALFAAGASSVSGYCLAYAQ